jgi:hypothetical protein
MIIKLVKLSSMSRELLKLEQNIGSKSLTQTAANIKVKRINMPIKMGLENIGILIGVSILDSSKRIQSMGLGN